MSLFTKEDREFSQRAKESDWSPTPDSVKQFRKDFRNGNPTTEELENHDDWKITGRGKTKIVRAQSPNVQGEILEATYCGDKNLDEEVVSKIVPRDYQ